MPKLDTAILREALSRDGLSGTELEVGVLAYKIANNLPQDTATEAEAMTEMKQRIAAYVRDTSGRQIN